MLQLSLWELIELELEELSLRREVPREPDWRVGFQAREPRGSAAASRDVVFPLPQGALLLVTSLQHQISYSIVLGGNI